jgi:protein-L-isoaspartate(D-aspartate) O-methyltransferase
MGTDYQDARQKMVDNQIRTTDVTSHSVLKAFLTVAREDFVPTFAQAAGLHR